MVPVSPGAACRADEIDHQAEHRWAPWPRESATAPISSKRGPPGRLFWPRPVKPVFCILALILSASCTSSATNEEAPWRSEDAESKPFQPTWHVGDAWTVRYPGVERRYGDEIRQRTERGRDGWRAVVERTGDFHGEPLTKILEQTWRPGRPWWTTMSIRTRLEDGSSGLEAHGELLPPAPPDLKRDYEWLEREASR